MIRGDSLRWPRNTLYPQKLALTSPTNGGRSVGIVRLRTKATELDKMGSSDTPLTFTNRTQNKWSSVAGFEVVTEVTTKSAVS
jgi:hypothetical protein